MVTYFPGCDREFIACEVKKSRAEVDQLIALMEQFCGDPSLQVPSSGRARNAFKKVAALRSRRAPLFWALGPDGYSKVFDVNYGENETIELIPVGIEELHFRNVATKTRRDVVSGPIISLRERVLGEPVRIHSLRLWRVAENIADQANRNATDDRLSHLMSRIGVLSHGVASDLRSGDISVDDAVKILDQLAELGEIGFEQWMLYPN